MKKTFIYTALLAVAAFTGSCANNSKEIVEVRQETGLPASAEINAFIGAETKTSMHADANGFEFTWEEYDRIHLEEFSLNTILYDPAEHYNNRFVSDELETSSSTASFHLNYGKTEALDLPHGGKLSYIASYPNELAAAYPVGEDGSLNPKSPHHAIFMVEIPNFQYPTAECFDPSADVMVSQIVEANSRPSSFTFHFARVGAVLRLRLAGLPAGYKVVRGEFNTDAQGGDDWGPAYQEAYDPYRQCTFQPDKPSQVGFVPEEVYVDESGIATIWLRVKGGILHDRTVTAEIYVQNGKGKPKHYGYSVDLRGSGNSYIFKDGGMTSITMGVDRIYDVVSETYSADEITSSSTTIPVQFDIDEIPYSTIEYGVVYSATSENPTIEDGTKIVCTPNENGYAEVELTGLASNTEYYYRSYVIIDGEITYSSYDSFRTEVSYSAPTPVDLGLPSGVKWSPNNLGSDTPQGYGYIYRWGDVDAFKDSYASWSSYRLSDGNNHTMSKYVSNIIVGSPVDHKRVLEAADDAATYNLGEGWRTPCKADFEELLSNCDLTTETVDGQECFKLTSKNNDNFIYFPKCGYMSDSGMSGVGVLGRYRCADMDHPIERDYSDQVNYINFFLDNNNDPFWSFATDSKALNADAVRPVYGGAGVAKPQVAWTYAPASVGSTSVGVDVKFDMTGIPGYVASEDDKFYVLCCKKTARVTYQGKETFPAPYRTDEPSVQIQEVTDGIMRVNLFGLDSGTQYVYRAYCRIGSKSYYGETYSFTTSAE